MLGKYFTGIVRLNYSIRASTQPGVYVESQRPKILYHRGLLATPINLVLQKIQKKEEFALLFRIKYCENKSNCKKMM
jgi:hypothetical protein